MKPAKSLSGEKIDHKATAIFDNEADAEKAAWAVLDATSLEDNQVFVIRPEDHDENKELKLEPEPEGMWKTIIRSHVWLGLVGAGAGVVLILILSAFGIPFITQNFVVALALAVAFLAVIGMMFGGLVTSRPDHMPYMAKANSALQKGQYVLTVHAATADQLKEAKAELNKKHIKAIRTL